MARASDATRLGPPAPVRPEARPTCIEVLMETSEAVAGASSGGLKRYKSSAKMVDRYGHHRETSE